jgi:SAM-dependent methyltransferase
MIYNLIRKVDNSFGKFLDLEIDGFIGQDDFEKMTSETMSKDEWVSYRVRERIYGDNYLSWITLLATRESRKFFIFNEIVKLIPANSRVLDFGCGQGHVGHLLGHHGFDVSFCDYTDEVLPAKLDSTKERFFICDFNDFLQFNDYDFILLTQVDYIFTHNELLLFLEKASKYSVQVLFVNTQIIGPLRFIWNLLNRSKRLNDNKLKKHGYVRSLGSYKKLARQAKFGHVKLFTSNYNDLWTYHYILFN